MSNYKRLITCIALVACGSFLAKAAEFYPLPIQEAAVNAANYSTIINASDFVGTATNLTTTNTIISAQSGSGKVYAPVLANSSVQLVGARLIRAFSGSSNTNYSHTLSLSVGDGDSATKYVNGWKIHASNTPVYAISPIVGGTATTTLTPSPAWSNVTNCVAVTTISPTAGGATLYTVATNLTFTFTGNAEEKVTANTIGSLQLYWRVYK